MTVDKILRDLKAAALPGNKAGMQRFGINTSAALGVSIPFLRAYAKKLRCDHQLALELWDTNIHEARILAGMVDDPQQVTSSQMDTWVKDFNSWDLCDQVCGNLFDRTPHAIKKAKAWSLRKEEFIKRAGFVLMATLAVHNKEAKDDIFINFLPLIEKGAKDDRNFVKKAVNWALRQIGKRNMKLHKEAVKTAKNILKQESASARWIAGDALRELNSEQILQRIKLKK